MGKKVTQDEIKEWLALKERGYTDRAIGEKFHRDPKTIAKHLRPHLKGRGEGSPPDSELEGLKREKERQELLMELERAREARMKIPERLEELETTVKALGADQDQLREWFQSLPISNLGRKWECSQCGDKKYVTVKVKCSRCGHETAWGHQCPPEKKVKPAFPEY